MYLKLVVVLVVILIVRFFQHQRVESEGSQSPFVIKGH